VSLRDEWESQAERWTAWARTPAHDHHFWEVNLPAFLELVPPAGRLTVDLGCGEGRVGRLLRERGHEVVGFDGSPTLSRLAATHEDAHGVALADMAALPVRSGAADLAIAFMSLHDVDDMAGSVREAARVIVPGGRLCLAVVHPINSAGGFVDESAESPFVIPGEYLERFRYTDELERDGLPMTFHSYHHPFSAYMGALEAAGFLVEAVREPADMRGGQEQARWRRVPLFLHVRAVLR
jgi:SAM-dependent methyltransferase